MTTVVMRQKRVRVDQTKLDKAKKVLNAQTDSETLDRALSLVVAGTELDVTLRHAKGRTKLVKVFR